MKERITFIGEYNTREGNRLIHDRTHGRPPAQDFIARFDHDNVLVSTEPKKIPEEVSEAVTAYLNTLDKNEPIRGIEFILKEFRVKISYIIKNL